MDEFLKMDIFFVVTTVAVVVVTICIVAIAWRVYRILKNIDDVSLMVEEEGQNIREDIAQVRAGIKEEGIRAKHVFDFLGAGRKHPRSSKRS